MLRDGADTSAALRIIGAERAGNGAGDRQVTFQFSNYLIDVHKRKDNMRSKQGKESTRQTHDSQPMARRLLVTSKMA